MAVLKSINEFPDNAMDVLQDVNEYKSFVEKTNYLLENIIFTKHTRLGKYFTTFVKQAK